MKEAIIAKRIDLWLQILAVVIPFVWAVAAKEFLIILAAYISVGSVQILSCIFNKIGWNPNLKHNGRIWYERLLLVVLVVAGIARSVAWLGDNNIITSGANYVFVALPFFSPFMAIWYMAMTKEELMMARRVSARRVI